MVCSAVRGNILFPHCRGQSENTGSEGSTNADEMALMQAAIVLSSRVTTNPTKASFSLCTCACINYTSGPLRVAQGHTEDK